MSMYDRIIALCESRGIKGAKMCADIGMSKSLMTKLKNDENSGITAVTAYKIASYFGVSVEYLLGGEELHIEQEEEEPLVKAAEMLLEILKDEDFMEMFNHFHNLNQKKRTMVLNLVRSLAEE